MAGYQSIAKVAEKLTKKVKK